MADQSIGQNLKLAQRFFYIVIFRYVVAVLIGYYNFSYSVFRLAYIGYGTGNLYRNFMSFGEAAARYPVLAVGKRTAVVLFGIGNRGYRYRAPVYRQHIFARKLYHEVCAFNKPGIAVVNFYRQIL